MTLRKRLIVAVIATLVVALVAGGVGAGLTLAQQRAAPTRAALAPRPAVETPVPVAGHSLVGRVVSVEGDRLLVRDRQRRLREIQLAPRTIVRRQGKLADKGSLASGDRVAVIGQPGPGRGLVAKLIAAAPGATSTPATKPSLPPAR